MTAKDPTALDWDLAQYITTGTSVEPLVPVNTCEHWIARPIYFQNGLGNALPEIWLREGVCDRLVIAAKALPSGYRLVLLDGWRPKSLQELLFYKIREEVVLASPSMSDEEIEIRTLNFAARPSDDPNCPSPHITGGAVDVTLADEDGSILDMGGEFDEVSEKSWTKAKVPALAAERRNDLLRAMLKAGFTNLPSEWWHYDYGNWVWAWYRNTKLAHYGPTTLPHTNSSLE